METMFKIVIRTIFLGITVVQCSYYSDLSTTATTTFIHRVA